MPDDTYPKYQLPSGGWTTDPERAALLWARSRRATTADLELLARYRAAKGEWERLVREHGMTHVPGQPWPLAVKEAEAQALAMKEAAGDGQPGDPLCCQRYTRLHLPEFALSGCRWYGVTS